MASKDADKRLSDNVGVHYCISVHANDNCIFCVLITSKCGVLDNAGILDNAHTVCELSGFHPSFLLAPFGFQHLQQENII